MVGWHHRLNRHEFEQALGVGDGQGSLACCSSWNKRIVIYNLNEKPLTVFSLQLGVSHIFRLHLVYNQEANILILDVGNYNIFRKFLFYF